MGEAPGAEEALAGEPLVGSSGKVFNSLLRKAGIQRDQLTLANTLSCRPPDNLYPTDGAARGYISQQDAEKTVGHCYRAHLKPLLDSRPWERIDALGEKSLRVLTGKSDGILKWRGSPLALKDEEKVRVMPTLHPAFIMRMQEYIPTVISDLTKGLQVPPEHYNLQPTLDDLEAFNSEFVCVDIETNRFTGQITMIGLATKPYHVMTVPYRGAYIPHLKRILENVRVFVGQNLIQFDLSVLEQHGIRIRPDAEIYDIMLMFHLSHPDAPRNDLEYISSIFTQKPAWKHLQGEDMALYNARDVDVTIQAYSQLKPLLKMLKLDNLYQYTQVPLAKICHQMTTAGVRTDGNQIKKVRAKLIEEVKELEKLLPEELKPHDKPIRVRKPAPPGTLGKSGKPIKFIHEPATEYVVPWNSPKTVERWLYETLGLPKQLHRKTKKVTSDKGALEKLFRKTQRPDIDALRQLRQKDELLSTFLKEQTVGAGRVHSNFLVHGTATGRLSSSGPNMQNISPAARYIYVPSHADWIFIEADFASLENRLAAWYANDEERLARLADPNFNEHRWLASRLFDLPESELTKDTWQYKRGKNTNHGADGGMGPRMLSMTYDIPEKDARDLIYKWKTINHKSAAWQERIGNEAIHNGSLTTVFGRKRWFWCLSPETKILTSELEWKSVGALKLGEELIGFDEDLTRPTFKRSIVTATETIQAPRYKITTDKGEVICTPNHKWAVRLGQGGRYIHRWLSTDSLTKGDPIIWFAKPWTKETSWDAAWLSGLLDGEGHLSNIQAGRGCVNLSQKLGPVLNRAMDVIKQLGISATEPRPTGNISTPDGRIRNVMTTRLTVDGPRSALEILGRLQPTRLKNNAVCAWENKPVYNNQDKINETAIVLSIESLGEGPVVALSTSTETLIAEGMLSHNTTKAYTEGVRFPPQSTGADISFRAMISLCYEQIKWPIERALKVVDVLAPLPWPARLLLQVHDSLLVECPLAIKEQVIDAMRKAMTQPFKELGGYSIPIDVKVGNPGDSWAELKLLK